MAHSPNDSATSSALPQSTPAAPEQFEQINTTLQTLIGLIMPLHQLLEAQKTLDDGITSRLEDVMKALSAISINLQKSADSMSDLTKAETLSPVLHTSLSKISTRQSEMEQRLSDIEKILLTIRDWLNVPAPHMQAAPRS